MMSQQDLIHQHVFTTINEYLGFVYRVSSTVRDRRHLNDNEINFLFGANHPALGTELLIFVHGGTWAISSEYKLFIAGSRTIQKELQAYLMVYFNSHNS